MSGYSGSTFFSTKDFRYLIKSVPRHFEHSFFKDETAEPKKVSLTPSILRDIDESDRDLNRDMYPNRTKANRFNFRDADVDGGLGGHLRDFYGKTSTIRGEPHSCC